MFSASPSRQMTTSTQVLRPALAAIDTLTMFCDLFKKARPLLSLAWTLSPTLLTVSVILKCSSDLLLQSQPLPKQ